MARAAGPRHGRFANLRLASRSQAGGNGCNENAAIIVHDKSFAFESD
jgi:hypothetical protein